MKIVVAITMLLINFIKMALLSGIDTARLILAGHNVAQDGLARIDYGDLNPGVASFLGAMLTLTPGTTLIDIDIEKRQLVMHLLTLSSYEKTVDIIQRDFCDHLKVISRSYS